MQPAERRPDQATCVHIVGDIAGPKTAAEWPGAIEELRKKIAHFNTIGQVKQVNHPGFANRFNFCPLCGARLAPEDLDDTWPAT